MSAEEAIRINRSAMPPASGEAEKEAAPDAVSQRQQNTAPDAPARSGSLFEDHKGKLAVGAAAMLGLAVFYKWRENRLAKDDPEEYARLRRLKAAVGHDEPAEKHKGRSNGKQ